MYSIGIKAYFSVSQVSRAPLKTDFGGAWVAQSVKRPTLDFGSGHDLTVHGFGPHVGCRPASAEPAWDSVSLLSLHSLLVVSLFLKITFKNKS